MDFAALIYHRQAFLDGQWWLPLTAQLAHFNTPHALVNLLGAALLGCLFVPWLDWPQQAIALVGGVIGVALVVVLDTHCTYYAGASGALHGLAVGGAVFLLRVAPAGDAVAKSVAYLLLGCVLAKLGWQLSSPADTAAWGFPVYRWSHTAGALGGWLAACLAGAVHTALSPRCR